MASRKYKPEGNIVKLREAEIVTSQGGTVADACRRIAYATRSLSRQRQT